MWKLGQRFLRFFTFFWHDTSKTRKSRVFEFSKKRKNVFSNYDRGSKGPPIGNGIWAIKWSRVLWDSIVGYPSDSLASCQYIIYVGYILRHQMSRLYLPSALCNVMIINDIYRAQTSPTQQMRQVSRLPAEIGYCYWICTVIFAVCM